MTFTCIENPSLIIELLQERLPPSQPIDIDGIRVAEPFESEMEFGIGAITPVRVVRRAASIELRCQWIVSRPEPTGVFARPNVLSLFLEPTQAVWHDHVAR